MRAGLELRVAVLVRRLGDVSQLEEMRPGVLGQDGAGLVGDLQVTDSEATQSLSHSHTNQLQTFRVS